MKSLKKNLLTVFVVFFLVIVVFGMTEGLYYLFLFPMLALTFFVSFFLYKQSKKDQEDLLKRNAKLAVEDAEAEKWIEKSLAPDTLKVIKAKRFSVIIYSVLLFLSVTFLWSYLSNGLLVAIRNFTYAAILLLLFIIYVLTAPSAFEELHTLLPKKLQKYVESDWIRGYFFLLPITFVLYLLYPFNTLDTQLFTKLTTFPLFFVVYSSFFVCIYCITYIYQDIHKEDEKELKTEVKEMLKDE